MIGRPRAEVARPSADIALAFGSLSLCPSEPKGRCNVGTGTPTAEITRC